jgi:hypothetical protein
VSSKSQFFSAEKSAYVQHLSEYLFFFCSFCFFSLELLKGLTAYIFIIFLPIENKQYTDILGPIFDKNKTYVTPELHLASISVSLWQGVKIY